MGKVSALEWRRNICFCCSEFSFGIFLHSLFYSTWKRLPVCESPHNHGDSRLVTTADAFWNFSASMQQSFTSGSHHSLGGSVILLRVLWAEGARGGSVCSEATWILRLPRTKAQRRRPTLWVADSWCSLLVGLTLISWIQPKGKGPRKPRDMAISWALMVIPHRGVTDFFKKKLLSVRFVGRDTRCQILKEARHKIKGKETELLPQPLLPSSGHVRWVVWCLRLSVFSSVKRGCWIQWAVGSIFAYNSPF